LYLYVDVELTAHHLLYDGDPGDREHDQQQDETPEHFLYYMTSLVQYFDVTKKDDKHQDETPAHFLVYMTPLVL
jgi:hypothetical protein